MRRPLLIVSTLFLAGLLGGCDMLGIETPAKVAQQQEAEGKAVGAACRHAARAIEDCYAMNKKSDKAAVFAGWKEMNDYMRENQIEPVIPQGVPAVAAAAPAEQPPEEAPVPRSEKGSRKGTAKHQS